MIVTKCPLRLSLVGGSTDLKEFISHHGRGSVISFPCSMYVYITLHENNPGTIDSNKFVINYTKREEVENISDIHNDVAREVLMWFDKDSDRLPKMTISFKSDVNSQGSGLAASSAYMIAMIKALCLFTSTVMSDIEICTLAHRLEQKFNPLVGYQDPYGCGMSGFKRMTFNATGNDMPDFRYFDSNILNKYDMWLVHTGVSRSSTKVLKSLDLEKRKHLLDDVNELTWALEGEDFSDKDSKDFIRIIRRAWENKQATSPHIMTEELKEIENVVAKDLDIQTEGYKLCGAGGGGYFLVFTRIERQYTISPHPPFQSLDYVKVEVDQGGVTGVRI